MIILKHSLAGGEAAEAAATAAFGALGVITDVCLDLDGVDIPLSEKKGKCQHALLLELCATLRCRISFSALPSEEVVNALLDVGALTVQLPVDLAHEGLEAFANFASCFPRGRVVAACGKATEGGPSLAEAVAYLRDYVGGIVIEAEELHANPSEGVETLLAELATHSGREGAQDYIRVCASVAGAVTPEVVGAAHSKGVDVLAPAVAAGDAVVDAASEPAALAGAVAQCFVKSCRTDRADGLFTTVVCDEMGVALGLVYSSEESIVRSIVEQRGIYYSRSRNGLWRKGDSSGAVQLLRRVDTDCDGDALRFLVLQRGGDGEDIGEESKVVAGHGPFCHCGTRGCWGDANGGIIELQRTLFSRKVNAPEGSYTQRLFSDPELLKNKLLEEAQELIEAEEPDHVAAEAADVLYFAMVRMAAKGVTLQQAAQHLNRRSLKVKRRPGNAKAYRIAAAEAVLCKESNGSS